jgi:hypothetical protein
VKLQKDVLTMWQSRHGKLGEYKLMQDFLGRNEVRHIGRYPKEWIKDAFDQTNKLETALLILRWRAAIEFGSEEENHAPVRNSWGRSSPNKGITQVSLNSSSPSGRPELDVVGESFYRENFHFLRESYRIEGMAQLEGTFKLARDPGNTFSKSGRAVKVLFDTLTVGFVPEFLAPAIYSVIEEIDREILLKGTIWFDSPRARNPRNSVRIYSAGPYEESRQFLTASASLPKESGISQAEKDAAAWRARHPDSTPLEPVWRNGTEWVKPQKKAPRKPHVPFKMSFYCEKCHGDAGSRLRPCASCGTLMRLPRFAGKTLGASKARWEDERAKRKLEAFERRREEAKREQQRFLHRKKQSGQRGLE